MTQQGFDWEWDTEHETWKVYPRREEHEDNDFLTALRKTLGES